MVLEAINHHTDEAMCKLLKSLSNAIIITEDMMERVSHYFANISVFVCMSLYMLTLIFFLFRAFCVSMKTCLIYVWMCHLHTLCLSGLSSAVRKLVF